MARCVKAEYFLKSFQSTEPLPIGDDPPEICPYCQDPDCLCPPPEDKVRLRGMDQWVSYECYGKEDKSEEEPRPTCPYCGDTDCVCPPSENSSAQAGTCGALAGHLHSKRNMAFVLGQYHLKAIV